MQLEMLYKFLHASWIHYGQLAITMFTDIHEKLNIVAGTLQKKGKYQGTITNVFLILMIGVHQWKYIMGDPLGWFLIPFVEGNHDGEVSSVSLFLDAYLLCGPSAFTLFIVLKKVWGSIHHHHNTGPYITIVIIGLSQ